MFIHLDWDGSTKYMSQWNNAIAQWNKTGSFINSSIIRKDTAWIIQDVKVQDVNRSDANWVGMCYATGTISLNTYFLDTYTSSMVIHTCLHELGHALGLIHGYGPVMSETAWPDTLSSGDNSELRCVYDRWWT